MTRPTVERFGWALLLLLMAASRPSSACEATVAPSRSFAEPSPSSETRFWYGSETLAVLLKRSGAWQGMGPQHDYRDKLFWWRKGYSGATEQRPTLVVSGRRVDGDAPLAKASVATNARHSDFGGWAMLVMLEFPTSGCWEVTGEYQGHHLSFVVRVGT